MPALKYKKLMIITIPHKFKMSIIFHLLLLPSILYYTQKRGFCGKILHATTVCVCVCVKGKRKSKGKAKNIMRNK